MNGSFDHSGSLPLAALTGTSGRGYRPAHPSCWVESTLIFRLLSTHLGRLHNALARTDTFRISTIPPLLISELDLGPLGRVALSDEDVVKPPSSSSISGAFRNQDCVRLVSVRISTRTKARGGSLALGFDRDGDLHGAAGLVDDRANRSTRP